MREWLPDLVLTSAAGVGALRLTDIQAFSGNCSVVSKLQSWACSFKSSARWPPVGVEAGPGYVYFPELSTSTRAASPALAAWRVNVTCPAADWATLVGPLQPCGTVTVRTGEQLLAALAQLQPTHAQLLLTLAANISLPASPTDQLSPSSPDDSNPLGVIYRNTTFAGLRAGINSSSAPAALRTELDVRSRRNALQLLTTLPPGALPLTTMPSSLGAAANSTNSSPINTSSSSGSNSSAGRVALNLCDLTLVNMPPGQPSTWPVGLTAVEMWHLGVDRSPGAPVQARHVRVALMYNVGQLRYLSFWFARLTSMVAEEQQSAKWLGDILTPPLQATDADGQLTSVGTTRSYLEKYNTTTAATPLLTAPMPAVVDLWSVEDPPADPSIILFAANVTQLRAQLQRPWSGPRVIVLLDDIVLDASNWSNEGILVASDITVSGPSAAGTLTTPAAVAAFYSNLSSSPTSPTSAPTTPATFASTIIAEHRQHSRQLLLYLSSLPLALPPPGNRLSLRNLHVVNASLSVTWALPAAPAVLPRVPGYDLWRGRCLPGFNDQSIGRFEFNGCSADAPPDFFALLKLFNSPTCTTSAATGAVVCTVPGVAKIAAGFPYLPDELNGLFNQLLVASGQVPVAQPTNDTLFYTAHTAGGAWWNSTTFHLIPQRATAPSSSSSSGGSGSSSGGNATVAAASPPPPLSVMALALSGPCDLQTLLTLLRAANSSSRTNSSGSSGGAASSSTDTGVIVGAVVGCVVGVGLLAAAAFFGRRAYLTRHDQRRDQEKQRADQEKQQPDTQQHKLPAATAGERDGSNGDLCRDAKDDSLSGAADGGAAPAADSGWGSSSKGAGKAAVAVGSAAAAAAAPGVAGLSPAEVRISISQQEDGPAQERALLALPLAAGGQHDVAAAAAHADGAPQHLWEGSAFSKSFAAGTAGGATMLEVATPRATSSPSHPNKVVLEIDGAEADLTIIDLPGIIHDHPKGRHLVEVVERMTKTNLAPAHHIIAMALPAGLDPETQAIRLWAREVDPDGHRSIGIITKPDMIAEEAHIVCNKLVKLVGARGELGPGGTRSQPDGHLRLGYYVVKNPSQEQLVEGITFEKAREIEARYFANHVHWRPAMATSPGLVQRLGANALRSGLSLLLVERIEEQMPAMRKSAREQLDKLRAELASLPPVCVDPNHELFQLLWRVADGLDAAAHARSDTGDHAFYQLMDRFYREYGRHVMRSTPAFLVGTTLISALNKSEKMMGAGGGDDGGDLDLQSVLPVMKQAAGGGAVTSSERVEAALAAGSEAVQELLSSNLLPQRPMTLAEVSRLRQRHLGRELPGFSPYSAMEELLRRFKGQWREHAEGCLQEVEAAVRELAGKTVAEQLRRYPKAERVVGRALSSHVDTLVAAAEAQLSELLGMEDSDVFTLNDHYLRDTQSTFLARLKRAYLQPQALDDNSKYQVQNLLNQLAGYGVKFTSYDAAFLAQPTPVDDELHMAASCLAYFKVAFKRIQDEVPMAIRRTLLRRLGDRQQLEAALRGELPDVAAEARGLLEEDAAVSERRRQCVDMERRLREALTVLHSPATQL